MADFAGGKIQAFVGPTELGAADDLETTIVDSSMKRRSRSTSRCRRSTPRSSPRRSWMHAGAASRSVFLEHSYLQTDLTEEDIVEIGNGPERLTAQWVEPRPSPEFRTNRDILAAILRTDIEVHSDFNQDIFHQKFVIRDYRGGSKPTSALLTSRSCCSAR